VITFDEDLQRVRFARGLKLKGKTNGSTHYEAELVGLDVFDPVEMKSDHRLADDVPA
jgi:hypothetical protein